MRFFCLIFCALVAISTSSRADSVTDQTQNNAYVRCLLKRGVEPPALPKADDEFCLRDAGVADPGEEQRREKGNAWRACLRSNAARLDDQVSSPRDVGQAVVALCVSEWREYAGSLWMTPGAKRRFVGDVERYGAGDGVQAVLLTRKTLREKEGK